VRIVYDPSGDATANVLNQTATQSVVFNEVVDLTKDSNVEIRVPYQQALAWCTTFNPVEASQKPFTVGTATTFKHVASVTNGMLAVRVVTGLTSPILASTIQCIVSVRGAENLEFANPSDISTRYSYFAAQSDEYDETDSDLIIAGHSKPSLDPNRYLVNFGEQITSIRQMLRRFQWYRTTVKVGDTTSDLAYRQDLMYKLPPFYGYTNNGWDQVKGLITPASTFKFNQSGNTYLHWVVPAFIGQRGSVNYTIVQDSSHPTPQLVLRQPTSSLTKIAAADLSAAVLGTSSIYTSYMRNTAFLGASSSGIMATSNYSNSGVSWQFPNYSAYKFNVSSPENFTATINQDDNDTQSQCIITGVPRADTSVVANHWFVGAGTDFMPIFFLNVPTVFVYSGIPTPV
jgi:hypothetical protein